MTVITRKYLTVIKTFTILFIDLLKLRKKLEANYFECQKNTQIKWQHFFSF